jgi:hypothetical protein
MGFAVFHVSKGKSNSASLGAHIDRKEGQEHTFRNADPARRDLNRNFDTGYSKMSLNEAVKLRIKEGYTGTKAIRKDAVEYVPMVFTGSHVEMKAIEQNPTKLDEWIQKNYQFACREFGKENILRFTLHLDEKTPHIHAVIVPLVDGKLTAKVVLGDRVAMSERQTRYAAEMQEFGLERGVVGSKRIHNSEGWYLGQQKSAQEAELSQLPKFELFDRVNPRFYVAGVTWRLKEVSRRAVDAELRAKNSELQVKQARGEVKQISLAQGSLHEKNKALKNDLSIALNFANEGKIQERGYVLSPESKQKYEALKNDHLEDFIKSIEPKLNQEKTKGNSNDLGLSM